MKREEVKKKIYEISYETRLEIISFYKINMKQKEIAEKTGVSLSSVKYSIRRYKDTNKVINRSGRGRKRKTTKSEDKKIVKLVKKNSDCTTREIEEIVNRSFGFDLDRKTIINRCSEKGLKQFPMLKKPFLSIKNINLRFQYSKDYFSWLKEDWCSVLCVDECKILLHSTQGKKFAWEFENEAKKRNLIQPTFKDSQKIMIWSSISANGVGSIHILDKIMDGNYYLKILKEYLIFDGERLIGEDFFLLQDNDPKHNSNIVQEWLSQNGINMINHPPQSPDLNPIENCYYLLKKKFKKEKIDDLKMLKEKVVKIWNEIPKTHCYKLITSMENHILDLYNNNGGSINY